MTIKSLILKSILALSVIIFMSACNSETEENKIIGEHYKKHMKYPTKPQAPLDMTYHLSKNIEVGENLEVELVFKTRQNVQDLTVKYLIGAELQAEKLSQETSLGPQLKQSPSQLILNLVPRQEGFYYIKVFATITSNDIKQSRSFAIPVNVGNVNAKHYMKKTGEVKIDSTGQKIISMPASQPQK